MQVHPDRLPGAGHEPGQEPRPHASLLHADYGHFTQTGTVRHYTKYYIHHYIFLITLHYTPLYCTAQCRWYRLRSVVLVFVEISCNAGSHAHPCLIHRAPESISPPKTSKSWTRCLPLHQGIRYSTCSYISLSFFLNTLCRGFIWPWVWS